MSKKEQNKEPKTQTVEQPKEQPTEQPTKQPKGQPTEQPKEQKQASKARKPASESDADTAKRLMEEYGVGKIYKAGNYWFKKHDDAEAWAKQQGCKVEEYGGK